MFILIYKIIFKIKAPSKSPDLNPIQLVWNELKNYVRSKECNTIEEMAYYVEEFQRTILTPQKCENYISHIKKVMEIIIERNGGWSDC